MPNPCKHSTMASNERLGGTKRRCRPPVVVLLWLLPAAGSIIEYMVMMIVVFQSLNFATTTNNVRWIKQRQVMMGSFVCNTVAVGTL